MVSCGPNSTGLLADSHLGPLASGPSWDPLLLVPVQTRCYWLQLKPIAIGSTWVPAPTYSTCCWSHVEPVLKPLLVPLAKNCTKQRPVSSFLHTFIGFASDQGLENIRACSILLTMAPQAVLTPCSATWWSPGFFQPVAWSGSTGSAAHQCLLLALNASALLQELKQYISIH